MDLTSRYMLSGLVAALVAVLAVALIYIGTMLLVGCVLAAAGIAILTVVTIDLFVRIRERARTASVSLDFPGRPRIVLYGSVTGNFTIGFSIVAVARGHSLFDATYFGMLTIFFMLNIFGYTTLVVWIREYRFAKTEEEKKNAKDTILSMPILLVPFSLLTFPAFVGILTGMPIMDAFRLAGCYAVVGLGVVFLVTMAALVYAKRKNRQTEGVEKP